MDRLYKQEYFPFHKIQLLFGKSFTRLLKSLKLSVKD